MYTNKILMTVEPPSNFVVDEVIGNMNYYYWVRSKDNNLIVIDVRQWANATIHICTPMYGEWRPYTLDQYEEIKVFLEAL